MKCPRCGKELRRSKKDPSFGLCDHCRKKYKWITSPKPAGSASAEKKRPAESSRPIKTDSSPRRRRSPETRFQAPRLIIGLISILLFAIITVQSLSTGIGNILADTTELSGSAGFLLALCMLIAGIITISMRKKETIPAFLVPGILLLVGSVVAAANVGNYKELIIWSVLAGVFAALHFLFLFICSGVNKIIAILIPVLLLLLVGGFIFAGSKKENQEKNNNSSTDAASKEDDGVIDMETEDFHIAYIRYEIETDTNGNDCLLYYYKFTNYSKEAASPATSVYIQAFQNGISCDSASIDISSEELDNYLKEIQSGETVDVCQAYSLSDTSDITMEAKGFMAFDGKEDTQILTVE